MNIPSLVAGSSELTDELLAWDRIAAAGPDDDDLNFDNEKWYEHRARVFAASWTEDDYAEEKSRRLIWRQLSMRRRRSFRTPIYATFLGSAEDHSLENFVTVSGPLFPIGWDERPRFCASQGHQLIASSHVTRGPNAAFASFYPVAA
jgi:hypothetical protein